MEDDILKKFEEEEIKIMNLEKEVHRISTEINRMKNMDKSYTKTKNKRKNTGPKALISKLISEKPWEGYKSVESIKEELKLRGYTNFSKDSINMALLRLVRESILERQYTQSNKNRHKEWKFKINAK